MKCEISKILFEARKPSSFISAFFNLHYCAFKEKSTLHIGTNDLNSDISPELIAKSITDVGSSLKNYSHDVSISSIILKNDKLKEKAAQVNENLANHVLNGIYYFINHAKNILPQQVNKSRLHLNRKRSSIFTSNFVKALPYVFNWLEETIDKDSVSEDKEKNSKSVNASINCSILGYLRRKHLKKVIIANVNINSFVDQIKGKVDLLMVSEMKLDENFSQDQFKISSFSRAFRPNRNSSGGVIIWFIRDIPAKLIFSDVLPTEGFYVEINLRKQKWLICCSYNPNKHKISKHIEALSKSIDLFSSNYENFLLMGDFNAGLVSAVLKDFCNLYNFTSLINYPILYWSSSF